MGFFGLRPLQMDVGGGGGGRRWTEAVLGIVRANRPSDFFIY